MFLCITLLTPVGWLEDVTDLIESFYNYARQAFWVPWLSLLSKGMRAVVLVIEKSTASLQTVGVLY